MHKPPARRCDHALLLAAALLLPAAAAAEPPDVEALRLASLAATCNACHGTSTGAPGAAAAVPALTGLGRARIRDTMQAFKQGARDGTVMPQLAKGYSDAQIERIAAFYGDRTNAVDR
jgi:cytochrome c553